MASLGIVHARGVLKPFLTLVLKQCWRVIEQHQSPCCSASCTVYVVHREVAKLDYVCDQRKFSLHCKPARTRTVGPLKTQLWIQMCPEWQVDGVPSLFSIRVWKGKCNCDISRVFTLSHLLIENHKDKHIDVQQWRVICLQHATITFGLLPYRENKGFREHPLILHCIIN